MFHATFTDTALRKLIEDRFGKSEIARILEEHDAAPEQRKDNPQ